MKIVVLDGYALNPGDLDWQPLAGLGKSRFMIALPIQIRRRSLSESAKASAVFTNKTPLTKEILQACPNIDYIGVLATGYNVVDLQAAASQGITVTNIPSYSTNSVAQSYICFIT